MFQSWGLTVLNWVVKLSVFSWILLQFIDSATIPESLMAVVAGDLTSVLPIHGPAGSGTYEAGWYPQ